MTALDTQDDAAPPDEPEAVVDEDVKPETGKDVKPETDDGGAARPAARGKPRLQLEELVVGAETRGKVVGLSKFGAFVDIGAVTDGLVHISELSDRRVRNVEDVVKSGDTVDVWVKDVDLKKKRISLSMRKKPDRPMDTLKPGAVVAGKVTSVTKYGAFVDIGAETEGLVHVSEMSSGFVQAPSELVEVGKDVEVRVKEIDRRRERISLSMKGLTDDEGDYVIEEEDDEPMPTAMELALRKALGGGEADGEESEGDVEVAAAGDSEMGDVYARMLEEYRASQDDE